MVCMQNNSAGISPMSCHFEVESEVTCFYQPVSTALGDDLVERQCREEEEEWEGT